MREYNLLQDYPPPKTPRLVSPTTRTIENRIVASYRDQRYYDGERNNGYGGYQYDGRWKIVAKRIMKDYVLSNDAKILQIGCEKGFLLHDLHHLFPNLNLSGYEISNYAIENAMPSIQQNIQQGRYEKLPFGENQFDFIVAIGVIYPMNLVDGMACLKEIQRVGKGKSFITLGSYETQEEFELFRMWTLLGATILSKNEWKKVLEHVAYTGDYAFVTAKTLNLSSSF